MGKTCREATNPADAEDVAARASSPLVGLEPAQILQAEEILWDLMAASYLAPLWAAAYQINGGCSDDGFDYLRGWLITQGRTTFEQAIHDPDSLTDHSNLPSDRHAHPSPPGRCRCEISPGAPKPHRRPMEAGRGRGTGPTG
ncbi:DUF4240 domain-containing protein [Streptomyces sp. NPDC000983]|uniref:DUF4240 domain-containing protein n=1 Tax=Streptomyces sp. NPDC000983 TaxID=3154373 RepID=UPI00331E246B